MRILWRFQIWIKVWVRWYLGRILMWRRSLRPRDLRLEESGSLAPLSRNWHPWATEGGRDPAENWEFLQERERNGILSRNSLVDHLENCLRDRIVLRMGELSTAKKKVIVDESSQTPTQQAPRLTSERRKRLREPTVNPEVTAAKKPEEERPRTSKKEEDWSKVPARKNLQKKKTKKSD